MKYIFVSFMVALSVTIFGYALYKYYKAKMHMYQKKIGYYYAVKANNEIILTRMVQGDNHDTDIV